MTVHKTRWRNAVAALACAALIAAAGACGGGDDDDAGATPETSATATRAAAPTTAAPTTATSAAPGASDTPEPAPTTAPVPTQAPDGPAATATAVPTKAPPPPLPPPPPPPPPPAGEVRINVAGKDLDFIPSSLSAPSGATVIVTLDNQDPGVQHDIVFYAPGGAEVAASDLILGTATTTVTFTPAVSGPYPFKCSVHPQQMRGVLNAQ